MKKYLPMTLMMTFLAGVAWAEPFPNDGYRGRGRPSMPPPEANSYGHSYQGPEGYGPREGDFRGGADREERLAIRALGDAIRAETDETRKAELTEQLRAKLTEAAKANLTRQGERLQRMEQNMEERTAWEREMLDEQKTDLQTRTDNLDAFVEERLQRILSGEPPQPRRGKAMDRSRGGRWQDEEGHFGRGERRLGPPPQEKNADRTPPPSDD